MSLFCIFYGYGGDSPRKKLGVNKTENQNSRAREQKHTIANLKFAINKTWVKHVSLESRQLI